MKLVTPEDDEDDEMHTMSSPVSTDTGSKTEVDLNGELLTFINSPRHMYTATSNDCLSDKDQNVTKVILRFELAKVSLIDNMNHDALFVCFSFCVSIEIVYFSLECLT